MNYFPKFLNEYLDLLLEDTVYTNRISITVEGSLLPYSLNVNTNMNKSLSSNYLLVWLELLGDRENSSYEHLHNDYDKVRARF